MRILIMFILIITSMISCSESVSELSDSELKFVDVMTDVYLVNGLTNQLQSGNKDSLRSQLTIQVLKKHDMDTTDFFSRVYKLEKNPAKFKLTYDSIVARLERLKTEKD
jgi:hypothetical protein